MRKDNQYQVGKKVTFFMSILLVIGMLVSWGLINFFISDAPFLSPQDSDQPGAVRTFSPHEIEVAELLGLSPDSSTVRFYISTEGDMEQITEKVEEIQRGESDWNRLAQPISAMCAYMHMTSAGDGGKMKQVNRCLDYAIEAGEVTLPEVMNAFTYYVPGRDFLGEIASGVEANRKEWATYTNEETATALLELMESQMQFVSCGLPQSDAACWALIWSDLDDSMLDYLKSNGWDAPVSTGCPDNAWETTESAATCFEFIWPGLSADLRTSILWHPQINPLIGESYPHMDADLQSLIEESAVAAEVYWQECVTTPFDLEIWEACVLEHAPSLD